MELKVIGVESLCLEGSVDYSIQAEDIIIYLCSFQGTLPVFSPILLFVARHDVKWRPCISMLRSIDIMTQYVMRVHTWVPNISWTRRTTALGLGIPWPPCWRFGTIPNHGLTWRPCHSQNRRGLGVKPVRTPVAILGSLGVCIYVPASRHWLISYSPIHLT